jgi:hypothetical protein
MPGRRLRDVLIFAVGRPLLFVFWALILWGTFVAAALAWTSFWRGPVEAIRATLDGSGFLGMANLGLAVLAVTVWIIVVILARRGRQGG